MKLNCACLQKSTLVTTRVQEIFFGQHKIFTVHDNHLGEHETQRVKKVQLSQFYLT